MTSKFTDNSHEDGHTPRSGKTQDPLGPGQAPQLHGAERAATPFLAPKLPHQWRHLETKAAWVLAKHLNEFPTELCWHYF